MLISHVNIRIRQLLLYHLGHFHAERENAATAWSIRVHTYFTATFFCDLFHNHQAEPNPVTVLLSCPMQLAELLK